MDDSDAELYRKWGAALARVRIERGMTQVELARAADLDSNTISRIERGLKGVSTKTQIALAKSLKVEVYDLFEYPTTKAAAS